MPLRIRVHEFEIDLPDYWCSEEDLKELGPDKMKEMLFEEDLHSFIEEINPMLSDNMELFWKDRSK